MPGHPDTCTELMRQSKTILVFPGGGRDMLKFKGAEYTLQWERRSGFARLAIEHDYPIVPVGLMGGDDVYRSLVARGGAWERYSRPIGERLHGVPGVGVPLVRGLGPTLLPRPNRMYLRFAAPIDTRRSPGTDADNWASTVKGRVQGGLEKTLADLQKVRAADPFRNLNPLAWSRAVGSAGDKGPIDWRHFVTAGGRRRLNTVLLKGSPVTARVPQGARPSR